MEKLIIRKRYDEFSDVYVYSVDYGRLYVVPSDMDYEGVEKYVAQSMIRLILQDFKSIDVDKDVEIKPMF